MTTPTFHFAYTCRSALTGGVGSRVTNPEGFVAALAEAVAGFDFTTTNPAVRVQGQGYLPLPAGVPFVSAGVGHKQTNPDAYVLRAWRGEVKAFLRREYAVQAETLAVVVYTAEAFLAALGNPDTPPEVAAEERAAFLASGATHAVVAVLASAGPSALGPDRLISNLAGGNAEAATWTAEEIREKARAAVAYVTEWAVVSD